MSLDEFGELLKPPQTSLLYIWTAQLWSFTFMRKQQLLDPINRNNVLRTCYMEFYHNVLYL